MMEVKEEESVWLKDEYEVWGRDPEFVIMKKKEENTTLKKNNEEPNKDCVKFRDWPGLHVPKGLEFHPEFVDDQQKTGEEAIV